MKTIKRKIKFRKNNSKKYKYNKKNTNKKREKKIYYKKLTKTKRLKGGVRESGRTRRAPQRLLDDTSREFEIKQKKREKEKQELIKQKKKEREDQEKINNVEDNPINKEILDIPITDKDITKKKDITVILEDNNSPTTNYKLKVNFRDIIVWKALSAIKKDIQKEFFKNTEISQNELNKYDVLHKKIFEQKFKKYIEQQQIFTFEQIKDLSTELNEILNQYLKEEGTRIAKYPGILSYIKNAFDEFKEYIFPKSKTIKDYSLFSYLVNYYYNIEFGSKINDFGVRFNNKVKERVKSLKNELDKNNFIREYPEYQHILDKYNRLNGTELKNSDLINSENYIGYQLTDKDITDILSTDELREYASRDEEELRELIQKTDELRKFDDRRQSSSLRSNRGSDDDY
uniref:Uncharacterized protein n=3 Tax=Nucleocytoviricota sp. TaxID=2809609 RepID=A0A9E8G4M8_9VIRU|nr:hypothetical protein [Nucleocytoviricota sp.]